ncbi:MAG TPA: outer membrane protein transport protein [Polyangia bacterium]
MKRIAIMLTMLGLPTAAFAGGFEFPDNGTEALGRGATFTAKADSPLALEYNIAGLAKQRGTKLLFDSNLVFQDFTFQRAGNYPVENIPMTTTPVPYSGIPYPKVTNGAGPFYAPFVGLTTDFNYFDRWTFGFGVYGPSAMGNKQWGATVHTQAQGDIPAPQRYDVVQANLLTFFPTFAAAVRVTKWLDVGLALHLVVGIFDLANISITDLGSSLCPNLEAVACDSATHLKTTGFSATAGLGLMFHPHRTFDIGLNVRGPIVLNTSGTVDATPPTAAPIPLAQDKAEFDTRLPPVVRVGLRYKFLGHDDFEHGDIELDGTWEGWSWAEGEGDHINIPQLGPFSDIHPVLTHHYSDTFSIRLGGAYNIRLPAGVFTLRLGGFYDSSPTKPADTRVDFDTMARIGATAGLGYSVRGVTLNVAYAYMYEADRNVTDGDIQSINGVANGSTMTTVGPTPVVNNGLYHAQNMILSFGLQIAWDELLKKRKTHNWQ